jgi:hypothetical protein
MEDFDDRVISQVRELGKFLRENPWSDADLWLRLSPLFLEWARSLMGIAVPQEDTSGPSSNNSQ